MSQVLSTFIDFLQDETAWEMFVSGKPGTGKTTSIAAIVAYCSHHNINCHVCAHTHKACKVLKDKLPEYAKISTTHSFLSKRPTINDNALKVEHISKSAQMGESAHTDILIIDEWSMIGESDYADLGYAQDPDATGSPVMKILYVGDPYQLPPVGDTPAIKPSGKYNIVLDKIYRQVNGNQLLDTILSLHDMISGATPVPLKEHKTFKRGVDLLKTYRGLLVEDKVILAYTNERVEELNAQLAGRSYPKLDDMLFSPTTKRSYYLKDQLISSDIDQIDRPYGDPLTLYSKYKTLEHLITMDCCEFAIVVDEDEDDKERIFGYVFGHYQYKLKLEAYGHAAVSANEAILKATGIQAKEWSNNNHNEPLARARAKAWRDYLTFKDCVICLDFPFAMTVHKSQGSTFKYVLLDMEDIGKCASRDYTMYLKLLYVGISRASDTVYTN